jgi:hypothetical protein
MLPWFQNDAFPLYHAPMAGVTDLVFRRLCKELGADVMVTEFVSAEGILQRDDRTRKYTEFSDDQRPVGVQLFGADGKRMGEAAKKIIDWKKPDFIDINFGCPVNKVVAKNGGSSLLKNCPVLAEVASGVAHAVGGEVPVTAKIRTGWDSESINAVEVAKILEDSGWRYERIMPDTDKPLPTRPKKTEQSSEEQLAEYREALVNRLLDDLGVTKDNIFLIPFSKHIANNGVASVERSKIGILALMAYSELLLHLMKLPAPTLEEKKARFEATMSQRGEDQMRRPTPVMDPATVDLNLQRLRDANDQGDGDGVKRTLAGIAEMLTKKPEAEAGMTEKE